ncbi:MAG: AMIN domain-containing protein, partial [Gammaproteobacteria bacterium]
MQKLKNVEFPIIKFAAALLLALGACTAFAGSLNDLKYTSLPGDRVQIKLLLSEPLAAEPLNFTIDNPARVALDFPGTTLALKQKTQGIGVGKVESVTAVEAEGRTRVVVNLVQLVPYKVESAGNEVTLTLEGIPGDITASPGAPLVSTTTPAANPATATMPGTASGARVNGIDFRRGPRGEAQIVVDLSDPNIGVNIEEQGEKLIVDFIDTSLPDALDRKLDVTDFATPAREIDTSRHGNG